MCTCVARACPALPAQEDDSIEQEALDGPHSHRARRNEKDNGFLKLHRVENTSEKGAADVQQRLSREHPVPVVDFHLDEWDSIPNCSITNQLCE